MRYRVLCDENVDPITVDELERRGIATTHVTDDPGTGSSDESVAEFATANSYLLLTNDDDFLVEGDHPDVKVLYHPENSVSGTTLARRIDDLRSWVPDPTDLSRVTFLTE